MICLSRQIMESEFEKYIEKIFKLPEVKNAKVRDVPESVKFSFKF